MANRGLLVLLVSDDLELCAEARREFETSVAGARVTSARNVAAARRILEIDSPAVILLEEASFGAEAEGPRGIVPQLGAVVTSLAVHAPVVVIGEEDHQPELSALIAVGAADYVPRRGGYLAAALGLVERRLQQAQKTAENALDSFAVEVEDFGEVLRHELNNPLTGILGNAELLLAEIHRKKDGKIPHNSEQRLETIAALAVRLRETVRRLSQEWEARHHPVQ